MKALILAAGKAASLVPFSGTRPAPMVKLCGRYVLETTLELLRQAGIGDVVLVVDGAGDRRYAPALFGVATIALLVVGGLAVANHAAGLQALYGNPC